MQILGESHAGGTTWPTHARPCRARVPLPPARSTRARNMRVRVVRPSTRPGTLARELGKLHACTVPLAQVLARVRAPGASACKPFSAHPRARTYGARASIAKCELHMFRTSFLLKENFFFSSSHPSLHSTFTTPPPNFSPISQPLSDGTVRRRPPLPAAPSHLFFQFSSHFHLLSPFLFLLKVLTFFFLFPFFLLTFFSYFFVYRIFLLPLLRSYLLLLVCTFLFFLFFFGCSR